MNKSTEKDCEKGGLPSADKNYVVTMARYNCWQNDAILVAADSLSEEERQKNRGAFFGSIEKTLAHVFWVDKMWMSRFTGEQAPVGDIKSSTAFIASWPKYLVDRKAYDEHILKWAKQVPSEWLEGDLTWYSGSMGREVSNPKRTLTIQFFNHQTHHRGQVHAMLTAAGALTGDTDVPFMPESFLNL